MENTGLQLSDLKVNNLPELQGWKEKQEKLVSENPFVEITDNKSYEVACKSRTALLKGRTELEKQDKLIASQLTSFRKDVKSETDNLIAITLPFEEKQQSEVKRYEGIKEAEKQEKERLEQLRIDTIKKRIEDFETKCFELISTITFENVEAVGDKINLLANEDFDYEEYDILFENAKARIQIHFEAKFTDVQEKENQRLENEKLAEENRILREANLERENKAKEEKEKIFEIRVNRLAEIGFRYLENANRFLYDDENISISKTFSTIYDCETIEFENIIIDCKESIEKTKFYAEELEKQKAIDLKLAEEDALRLKKENKERNKRLESDKKIISGSLEVYFADLHLETDNQETKDFVEFANSEIQELKTRLLTKLKNL
jgi:hypothetical protein